MDSPRASRFAEHSAYDGAEGLGRAGVRRRGSSYGLAASPMPSSNQLPFALGAIGVVGMGVGICVGSAAWFLGGAGITVVAVLLHRGDLKVEDIGHLFLTILSHLPKENASRPYQQQSATSLPTPYPPQLRPGAWGSSSSQQWYPKGDTEESTSFHSTGDNRESNDSEKFNQQPLDFNFSALSGGASFANHGHNGQSPVLVSEPESTDPTWHNRESGESHSIPQTPASQSRGSGQTFSRPAQMEEKLPRGGYRQQSSVSFPIVPLTVTPPSKQQKASGRSLRTLTASSSFSSSSTSGRQTSANNRESNESQPIVQPKQPAVSKLRPTAGMSNQNNREAAPD